MRFHRPASIAPETSRASTVVGAVRSAASAQRYTQVEKQRIPRDSVARVARDDYPGIRTRINQPRGLHSPNRGLVGPRPVGFICAIRTQVGHRTDQPWAWNTPGLKIRTLGLSMPTRSSSDKSLAVKRAAPQALRVRRSLSSLGKPRRCSFAPSTTRQRKGVMRVGADSLPDVWKTVRPLPTRLIVAANRLR